MQPTHQPNEPHAIVSLDGRVLKTFDSLAAAAAHADRHAQAIVIYTRSGKRPTTDMRIVEIARLEHYRQQLKETLA